MTEHIEQNVLKRMAEAGKPRLRISAMSPAKALRVGLAKAAQEVLRLPLVVEGVNEARLSLAELMDTLEDRAMFAVLNGRDEALGLAALSTQVVAGVVEMQTTGRISGTLAPLRRPTRTDAMMAVEFIDQMMIEFETALAEELDVIWAGSFRYGSFLNDARPLGLILEDVVYRVFRINVDMGMGAKRGHILLVLPANGRGNPPERRGPDVADPGVVWAANLEQAVLATPAQLEVILHRMTIPLAAVMGLKAGDLIPLPMTTLGMVRLDGVGGRKLATGKLGQSRGFRAVRLSLEDAEAVAAAMMLVVRDLDE